MGRGLPNPFWLLTLGWAPLERSHGLVAVEEGLWWGLGWPGVGAPPLKAEAQASRGHFSPRATSSWGTALKAEAEGGDVQKSDQGSLGRGTVASDFLELLLSSLICSFSKAVKKKIFFFQMPTNI